MNNNPLTNQTYINKDFQTIYPELLDLVKKLTYKWDPTISNESDPGVLLIKLNAIIADKNNYNIDKNILECFPDTVTQQDNAYKLFSQLGYNMRWYKSAMGEISIRWKGDPLESSSGSKDPAPIPAFTMVCNKDKDIVYTIINETKLPTDGSTIQTNVIQGVIRDMTIAGEFLINSSMLDYRNRICLPVTNVAENGIFISDAVKDGDEYIFVWDDPTKSIGWKKVDNLYIQPLNTKCYKFGIDQETSSCYIEFPNDITDIMGEGIRIKYIQSDGAYGNIAVKRLTQFYDDLEFDYYTQESGQKETINISLNSELTNYSSITNGKNPETIDEAYVNYKKELGTFDTLVTLRDYINYIVNEDSEYVSNGIVSDRTNDIQSSYDIVTTFNEETTVKNVVTIDKDKNKPEMSPFDLKTYFLSYNNWPMYTSGVSPIEQSAKFKETYDKTFNLILNENSPQRPLSTTDKTKRLYREAKSIEHDFIDKLPYRPLLIKNKFDLSLKIIPNNIVSQSQAEEIKTNINETLLKELQSKNISFGEEITYEQIYDICNSADNRVKAVALDSIEYHPFAMIYFDNINSVSKDNDIYTLNENTDSEIKVKLSEDKEITTDGGLFEIPIPTEITSNTYEELTLNELIALEICSKNILCGTTPMYHVDKSFNYNLNQANINFIENIDKITTSNEIRFNNITNNNDWTYMSESEGASTTVSKSNKSKMLENETLFLYAPSLIDDITYSTSVKYLYITDSHYTGNDTDFIPANQDYVLTTGHYLYFFWKEEDNNDAPYLYTRYEKGTILKSSTKLIKYKENDKDIYNECSTQLLDRGYTGEGQIYGELNDNLGKISGTILSATKNVVIKKLNEVKLTDDKNYCYWITNNVVDNKYRLTLKYVPKNGTIVDASYQDGKVYVSNFVWTPNSLDDTRTIGATDILIILQPLKETISYNSSDGNGGIKESTKEVTSYKVIKKFVTGDIIKCTSKIYDSSDVANFIKDTEENDIIPWGVLVTPSPTSNIQELKPDEAAKLLDENAKVLSNEYKIDKVTEINGSFGEGTKGYSTFEYLLKSNEMFIYTDSSKKSLYILENGTKITLIKPNSEIKNVTEGVPNDLSFDVLTMDRDTLIDDIETEGEKAFTDSMWHVFECNYIEDTEQLESGELIRIIENQILSLGAGTAIRVQHKSVTVGGNTLISSNFNHLKIDSENGVMVSSDGKSWVHKLAALSNYNIQYLSDEENAQWRNVPTVSDDSLGWDGYTILHINSGADKPQKLDSIHAQKFECHKHTDDTKPNPETIDNVYVQTSTFTNLYGGKDVNVVRTDANNNKYYLDIMYYTLNNIFANLNIKSLGNNRYEVTLNSELELKDISIRNNTILGIEFPTNVNDVVSFNITSSKQGIVTSRYPIGYSSDNPIVSDNTIKAGTYYYNITGTDDNVVDAITFSLTYTKESYTLLTEVPENWDTAYFTYFTKSTTDGVDVYNPIPKGIEAPIFETNKYYQHAPVSFIINPLFKYDTELNSKYEKDRNIPINLIEEDISTRWDVFHSIDGTQFDYTYVPNSDELIYDPLRPKNYFNTSHKYNHFTIPQISNVKTEIMNKRG